MPFLPKNFKFKKYAKGRLSPRRRTNQKPSFGHLAVKALQPGRLTSRQIEAVRKTIKKQIKPLGGIIRRKIHLQSPVTQKSLARRMGRGKGKVSFHVSPVRAGQILYEIYCPRDRFRAQSLNRALRKLPLRSLIHTRKILS